MKKAVLFCLSFVFLINSAGLITYYYFDQFRIRQEMKQKMACELPDSVLTVFAVNIHLSNSDFIWLNKREFRYHRQLFDVIRTVQINDSIFYYCLNDELEEQLFRNLDILLADYQDNDNPQKTKKWWNFVKKQDQVLSTLNYLIFTPGQSDFGFKPYIQLYNYLVLSIISPPPKGSTLQPHSISSGFFIHS